MNGNTKQAKVTITPDKVNECKVDSILKDTLSVGFKELAKYTNETDVANAMLKFRTSSSTIYRHLRGTIGILFFAIELYKFMFREVDERENLLARPRIKSQVA